MFNHHEVGSKVTSCLLLFPTSFDKRQDNYCITRIKLLTYVSYITINIEKIVMLDPFIFLDVLFMNNIEGI
jgi:hypothetical protein